MNLRCKSVIGLFVFTVLSTVFSAEGRPISFLTLNELPAEPNTFVLASFSEKYNGAADGDTWDTFIHASLDASEGDFAIVSLYLYWDSGEPMTSATSTAICNPCEFTFSRDDHQETMDFESLILAAGGFASDECVGFAKLVISGSSADYVQLVGVIRPR